MNKSFKRIVACMLMLCLMLCAAVPAAFAVETATDPVVYQFYQQRYTVSGNGLNAKMDAIAAEYAAGTQNWKYETAPDTLTANESSFRTQEESLRVNAAVNEWIAFRIKAPVVGKYSVRLAHGAGYYGAVSGNMYILPGSTTDIATAMATAAPVITFDCSASASEAGRISETGSYLFGEEKEYIVIFKATTKNSNSGSSAYLYLNALTATLVESYEAKTDTQYYTTLESAMEAAGNGGTVKLVADATVAEITVPAGQTLDLNGKTLTANVIGTGTVTDSSTGSTGKIVGQSAVQNVGENEIALYDGTTTRIVGYTLTPNGTSSASDYDVVEENGEVTAVKFWYTFTFDNDEAYKMIAAAKDSKDYANAKFAVGAELSFNNGTPKAADMKNATVVSDWAAAMAGNTENNAYAFYVSVTGFETLGSGVNGTLGVKLTVNGSAGSAESAVINYTID